MSSNALPRGYQLDEYEIEAVLGTGGFGITYQAHDSRLGTWVAIKEYFPQDLARRDAAMTTIPNPGPATRHFEWGRDQFLKEARALARFKHNNIVRVLRFVELNGTAYMIMEYEKGHGLLDHMRLHGPPDERMLLRVFVPILNGLQAVHRAGLLHLDIKPDNIYLRDEGAPMLIDFGSARNVALAGDTGERVALTPAYAALEQFKESGKLGPWTDLYAIGASLYHCVSGDMPVDALTRHAAIGQGRPDPLKPAMQLGKAGYSAYLLDCIDWAMALDVGQRPQRAVDLQEALMGKGRPDRKPAPRMAEPRPDAVRQPAPARASFNYWKLAQLMIAVLIVAGGVLVFSAYLGSGPRSRPEPVATPGGGEPNVTAQPSASPAAGTTAAPVVAETAAVPQWRDHPLRLVHTLAGHQDAVVALAVPANGAWLASASVDGTIRTWDMASGAPLRVLRGLQRSVHALAVSPDGGRLVSAGNGRRLLVWDPATGQRPDLLTGDDYGVYALAFSPDGRLLASAGRDRTIVLWDIGKRQKERVLEGHDGPVLSLAFSPDGEWLLSGGTGGQIRRWSVATGSEIGSLTSHRGRAVSAVAVSPDGRWFATASDADQVRLWSVESGTLKQSLAESSGSAATLAFSADGQQIVAAGSGRVVQAWDLRAADAGRELVRHDDEVRALALFPDRRTIATAGKDRVIRIWQAAAE